MSVVGVVVGTVAGEVVGRRKAEIAKVRGVHWLKFARVPQSKRNRSAILAKPQASAFSTL